MTPAAKAVHHRGNLILALAGAVSLVPSPVGAQTFSYPDATRHQVVPFMEGTYVFVHVPLSHIRFEGDIQPNLILSQNFSDKLIIEESLNGRPRFAFSISASPRVRLRMIEARSAPVRTPSYMPKGTFTGLFFRGESSRRVGIWAAQATVGHHSNGQDGCLFDTDVLRGDDCIGPADLARINRHDGSFATNYGRLGVRYRREWLRRTSPDEQVGVREVTVGGDFQQHFHTDPRVQPFYGTTRAQAQIGAATRLTHVCKSRFASQATLYYVGDRPSTVGPFAIQVETSCTFSDEGGWGIFARYYGGQDYYNLGFVDSIRRFQFGVSYDQDGFLRFISSGAKQAIEQQKRARSR